MKGGIAMRRTLTIFAAALAITSAGCGGEPRAPFTLQIRSADVVQSAVHQIEVVLRPSVAAERFQPQADMSHFGGTISTRVTGAGEFAIFVESGFIDANATPGDLMSAFALDVPLLLASDVDQVDMVQDPYVDVTFIRRGERIGSSTRRFLPWPLPDGGSVLTEVTCDRDGGFARQCTNNEPLPDSGAPPTDGGM